MFCTAPTGAGKTVLALAVIRRTLRTSYKQRVFYLCPTKALVNQVYLQVCETFYKVYPAMRYGSTRGSYRAPLRHNAGGMLHLLQSTSHGWLHHV